MRKLSLDQLLNIEVSTASRKEEPLSDAAAAVSVLTGDDIRRLGVTHLAEALRFVPGVDVARLSSRQWAVSVRGFNNVFANKLLVLVDGRTVYTPLFSGTFWEYQDVSLESIDRIEVVRGPGASVWGANAVNGVINIITKSARNSQGGTLSLGGGNFDEFLASIGYGIAPADHTWVRLDSNFRKTAEMEDATGNGNGDDGFSTTSRLRVDWEPSDTAQFTLIGGGQYAKFSERSDLVDLRLPGFIRSELSVPAANAHLLGRWTKSVDERSEIELQSYLDFSDIDSPWLDDERMNLDVELNHRWKPAERHDINWGIGYRLSSDRIISPGDTLRFSPAKESVNLFSVYLQDDFELVPDRFKATAGLRLEHNDYTGMEVQPTIRGLWKATEKQSVWASISRAVRTPSRAENDATVNLDIAPPGTVSPTLPAVYSYRGSDSFDAEVLWAFELGHRWQPDKPLHFDSTVFFNIYERLRGTEPGTPFPNDPLNPTYVVVPLGVSNDTRGNSWGAELAAVWQPDEIWRLKLGYSYIQFDLQGTDAENVEGGSPRHQVFLQSNIELMPNIEFDADLRYVDELSAMGIPSYLTSDVRLGWKPRRDLEFSIVGQNLIDSPHQEFRSTLIKYTPGYISRAVFGKITWSF